MESHQEEIRVLQSRNKTLRKTIKDLNEYIKTKDEEINTLRDQNKHFMCLIRNKNLEEREKLTKKVEEMEMLLKERDDTINQLNRKISIEQRNCKYKVNTETNKNRHLQKELQKALNHVDQLSSKSEVRILFSIYYSIIILNSIILNYN